MQESLIKMIENREAKVGIIGLGYVGLPILLEFAKAGFFVIGFDIDDVKISQLLGGDSYIRHIESGNVKEFLVDNNKADVTTEFSRVSECDAILICVPTPLNQHRDPELSYITHTAETISTYLRKGQIISLESTTYPGTTEEVLVPILEKGASLTAGIDFFVVYSPEREDPNNSEFATASIPKVIGGVNQESLEVGQVLYGSIISEMVPVSSCRAAEATKLMENIFRCVNIALVNELKMVFSEMDINIWEVIRAAKTKPFGYMPFYPGPGLGGHCIPIDPFYLSWKAREYGISTKFIELAGEINTKMPNYVIHQTMLALNKSKITLQGSRILIVGLAYKKNVDDIRESPAFVIWDELLKHGASVDYFDPYCPEVKGTREFQHLAGVKSRTIDDLREGAYDAAIIATDHDQVDHDDIASRIKIVVDTRGVCKDNENIYRA